MCYNLLCGESERSGWIVKGVPHLRKRNVWCDTLDIRFFCIKSNVLFPVNTKNGLLSCRQTVFCVRYSACDFLRLAFFWSDFIGGALQYRRSLRLLCGFLRGYFFVTVKFQTVGILKAKTKLTPLSQPL